MENVPGILTIGEGGVIAAIKAELKLMGYESVRTLSARPKSTELRRCGGRYSSSRARSIIQRTCCRSQRIARPILERRRNQKRGLKRTTTL